MIIFVIYMKNIFYAILSGLFFALSWPYTGDLTLLIFFSFIPLFLLHENIENDANENKHRRIFIYTFISFLIFNILTTYWVYYATLFGAVAAFLINSLLMTSVLSIVYRIRLFISSRLAYITFIVLWLSMEYLHLNWDLSWPWLTLGNVFANTPYLVQWYEFTGVLGGSLAILIINLLLFKLMSKKNIYYLKATFIFIILLAVLNFSSDPSKSNLNKLKVLVVQPNVDPYIDKFNIDPKDQLREFINLSRSKLTQDIQLLIGPETALQESIWENNIESTYSLQMLRDLQQEFPKLNIIIGASTYKFFENNTELSSTARKFTNSNTYYDVYNSAIFIPYNQDAIVYHKTKLVPGAEKIPFPLIFNSFSALSVNLGGVSGSLGSKNEVDFFTFSGNKIMPLICYESIYGDFLTGNNTDIICVITNDGWWRNTSGYKQHLAYSRLRAIEQRKCVIRSANTGISATINRNGEILHQTEWDEKVCFSSSLDLYQHQTFYNLYGDYIGRISVFITVIIFMTTFVNRKLKNKFI